MFYPLVLRDCIEIILFSSLIYAFCLWLKTDKTNNILIYFLTYCSVTLIAWTMELQTVSPFLLSYAPIALIIFIMLHERTLQRNFVTLYNPKPKTATQRSDWLDILLSCTLSSINANKAVIVVIEHNNSLTPLLSASFFIDALLGKELLDIILSSNSYDENKMIWIDTNGNLRGMNITWVTQKQSLEDDALFYSSQTDAIIFTISPITRTCTLFIHGTEFPSLSAHHVRMLIKKQLATTHIKNKGTKHERNIPEKSLSL